jgi:hypothetical protein
MVSFEEVVTVWGKEEERKIRRKEKRKEKKREEKIGREKGK